MAISNISIANMALTGLSTSRITAFDDDDENARKINALFEPTRDALLEEHNWNFAISEVSLALLSETPVIEDYAYAFQKPSDCIRIIHADGDADFKIVGTKVYTNENPLKVSYLKREIDPTKFSKGFVRAFASRLAADLAYGITANATLAQFAEARAAKELRIAKQSDAQEGSGIRIIGSQLITSRMR